MRLSGTLSLGIFPGVHPRGSPLALPALTGMILTVMHGQKFCRSRRIEGRCPDWRGRGAEDVAVAGDVAVDVVARVAGREEEGTDDNDVDE